MKWFKHISDSLDDPFIFDLMDKCGDAGYLTFFGIIEIYSREFRTELNWKLSITREYLKQKLCKRQWTLIGKSLEVIKNSGKWEVEYNEDIVTVFIPKFRELLDETTLRKLSLGERKIGSESGVSPKKLQTELEVDKEEDKDTDKDTDKDKERSRDSSKRTKKSSSLTDEQFLEYLSSNPAYQGINIQTAKAKCEAWCLANNRILTRRTFTNWLNREKPLGGNNGKGTNGGTGTGKVAQATSGAKNLGDGQAYPVDCEVTE